MTSSVRVRTRLPLCRPPFLQVAADREGRSKAFWCRLHDRKLCVEAGTRRLSVLLEGKQRWKRIRIELVVVRPANESDGGCVLGGVRVGWPRGWLGVVGVRR